MNMKQIVGTKVLKSPTGEETQEQEELGVVLSNEPMGEVSAELSHTMNLGNYQSLRMMVGIRLPVDLSKGASSEIKEGFKKAKDWCDEELNKWIEEANKTMGK